MRRADPGAKAVVFSAWGRLLRLVGEALAANGIAHVSLAGSQPPVRAAALRSFLNDPECAVILIVLSTGGALCINMLLSRACCWHRLGSPCTPK